MTGTLIYYRNGIVGKVDIPDMIIDVYLVSYATSPSTTVFNYVIVLARVVPPTGPSTFEVKLYQIGATTAGTPNPTLTLIRRGQPPTMQLINPVKVIFADDDEIGIADVRPGMSTQTNYFYVNLIMPAAQPGMLTVDIQEKLTKPVYYTPAGRNFRFCRNTNEQSAAYVYWSLGLNPEFGFADPANEYTVYSGGLRDLGVTEIIKVECFATKVGVIGKIGANTVMIGYDIMKVTNVHTRVSAIIKMGVEITNPSVYTENNVWYLSGSFSGTAYTRAYNETGAMLYIKSSSVGMFTVNL